MKLQTIAEFLPNTHAHNMEITAPRPGSEHWLTLMTCVICKKTPDDSPVFKCRHEHTVCYACFAKLSREDVFGVPMCRACGSSYFVQQQVSRDFLQKLKTKPGIGRPCRYVLERAGGAPTAHPPLLHRLQCPGGSRRQIDNMTVEDLFQLPRDRLHLLFEQCTKEKLRYLNSLSTTDCGSGRFPNLSHDHIRASISFCEKEMSNYLKRSAEAPPSRKYSSELAFSRKPLRCPHDACGKIIAISSFKMHYKHEHSELKRYEVQRGVELQLGFNPAVLEHGVSTCLAIVTLVDVPPKTARQAEREEVDRGGGMEKASSEGELFWLMVSASETEDPADAYAVFWLFTTCGGPVTCTIELSSVEQMMTMTTFCDINGVCDSQNVSDIVKKQNCLYVTHGTMKSMLHYGAELRLGVKIF